MPIIPYRTCEILPSCFPGRMELTTGEEVEAVLDGSDPLWPGTMIAEVSGIDKTYGGRVYTITIDDALLNGGAAPTAENITSISTYCAWDRLIDHRIVSDNGDGTVTTHNFDGSAEYSVARPPEGTPPGHSPVTGADGSVQWLRPTADADTLYTLAKGPLREDASFDVVLGGSDGSSSAVLIPNIFPASFGYDAGSNEFRIGLSDGRSLSAGGPEIPEPPDQISYSLAQEQQPFATVLRLAGSDGSTSSATIPEMHGAVPSAGSYEPDADGVLEIPLTRTDFSTGGTAADAGKITLNLGMPGSRIAGLSYDPESNLYKLTTSQGEEWTVPGTRVDNSVPGQLRITGSIGDEGVLIPLALRLVPLAQMQADIPLAGEMVVLPDFPGCTAIGDGGTDVYHLRWQGTAVIDLSAATVSDYAHDGGDLILPNAGKVRIVLHGNLGNLVIRGPDSPDQVTVLSPAPNPGVVLGFGNAGTTIYDGSGNNLGAYPAFAGSNSFIVMHKLFDGFYTAPASGGLDWSAGA